MLIFDILNLIIGTVFLLCYGYQLVYLIIAYSKRPKADPTSPPHRLAVLIAARNESRVIHNLLQSLKEQDYPEGYCSIFVVADNCTDNTAEIAREMGATVYERFNKTEVGKGYAIDYLIKSIDRDFGDIYDAYIMFDADNTLKPNYLTEMNNTFSRGFEVVSSYRNPSNYGENWRAGGMGMYFLRDSRVLNLARMRLGTNTYITGTGFLFSRELCKRYGGWPFHCLTEDGEFTMHNAVHNAKCGYCNSAMFFDEQPVKLRDSWNQQTRWCKGGLQIFKIYLPSLIKGIFSKRWLSYFDTLMTLTPAYVLSMTAVAVNTLGFIVNILMGHNPLTLIPEILMLVGICYFGLIPFSISITISEWENICASAPKKILYMFTFPLFLFTFIPAAFVALFKKVEWKQISHEGKKN